MSRPLRIALFAFGGLVAALLVLLLVGFGLLRSEGGQAWLKARIEAAVSEPGGLALTIGRLSGSLPGAVRLEQVVLSDTQGPWLTADRVALDWQPLALLAGRLPIDALLVGTLNVARAPVLRESEPAEPEPFSLPELPLEVTLERLAVERLELGAPLLGQPAALSVTGAAGARRAEGLTTELRVTRLDGVPGRIELAAGLDSRGETLSLDLTVAEPPGGLLARLLDLPDLPAVSLELHGAGPLAGWRGDLSGRLAGLAEWRGPLTLAVTGERRSLTLSGDLGLALDPATPLAALAGESVAYDLAASLDEDRVLTLDRVNLESPALSLAASGTLALEDLRSDLEARLALKQPEALAGLAPDLSVEDLVLEADAHGALLQPPIQAALHAARVEGPGAAVEGVDLTLDLTAEAPLGDPEMTVTVSGRGGTGRVSVEGLESLQASLDQGLRLALDGRLALAEQRFEIAALSVTGSGLEAEAQGDLLLATQRARLALDLALADLGLLAPLAGLPLAGSAALHGDLDAGPDDAEIVLPFETRFQALSLGQPAAESLLGPEPTVTGLVTLAAGGGVGVADLVLRGRGLEATAAATIPPGFATVEAEYGASLADLGPLGQALGAELAGTLTLKGTARGTLADPTVQAEIASEGLRAGGLALSRATVTVTAETPASAPKGRLAARLRPADLPGEVALDTDFRLQDSRLALAPLALSAEGTEANGELALDLDSGLASGQLGGEIGDLAPWLALAGLEGSGQGRLALDLAARDGRQAASARLDLTAPTLGSLAAKSLALRAESGDVSGLAGQADVEASGIRFDDLLVERLALTAAGGAEALDLTLSAEGKDEQPLDLDAAGRLVLQGDDLTLTLSRLQGSARGQAFALQAPLELSRSGERLALRGLDLGLAGGRIAGAAALDGPQVEVDLSVTALPLSLAREIAALPGLSGTLEARLTLEGAAPAPLGRATVTIAELETGAVADAPPLGVSVEAEWRAARLAIDGQVTGFSETPATLALDLPLRLDPAGPTPVVAGNEPLSGRLAWSGPIEQVWPLVPLSDQELSGATELQAEVTGTPDAPEAGGRLAITGGRYVNAATGTLLTDLELLVTLAQRRAVIERLSAADGGTGRLSAEGAAELLPEHGFPFALQAELTDFTALRRDEVTGALAGTVGIEGSLEAAAITGALETRGVEIRIPDQMPPEVVDLEVREVNRAAAGLPPEPVEAEGQAPTAVSLELGVDLPGRVFVRGRGLESEWRGNLKVTGSAEAPEIAGQLSVVRGQIAILGRDFALTTGRIEFPGGTDLDPLLDIVAENEGEEVAVAVKLFGPASRPQLELSSRPELPQDEVLARVLFDKSTTQLTPIEAVQLANAAAELSGRGSGAGVLDFARDLVGVDVLRFESAEGGSDVPTLAAGKYVTDKVYVGVKQGATEGSGSAAVEIEVYPHVLLESGVGQRGNSNLGVKFKWDY